MSDQAVPFCVRSHIRPICPEYYGDPILLTDSTQIATATYDTATGAQAGTNARLGSLPDITKCGCEAAYGIRVFFPG